METGEFQLIDRIADGVVTGRDIVLGIGDDAAVWRPDGDQVITTDLLVEGVHFKRGWSPAFQIGRKTVAVNVSDVESMGARPAGLVVAVVLPPDADDRWVAEFNAGIRDEAARAGISLIGGDLSGGTTLTICATAVGHLEGRPAVTRAGAKVGDQVAVAGKLGWAGAGLMVLQRGFGSPKELVAEQQCPTVPYGQGVVAAQAGATAMLDVSDGLLADLGHICERSKVGINVGTHLIDIPEPMQRVSAATGRSPWSFILGGGEDHALTATFPADATLPEGWTRVGIVVEGTDVLVDGEPWDGTRGWDHFAH